MRRHSTFLERREDLDVTMTPMIDVVFLLLIFFVWTASFQIAEYAVPSRVSQLRGTEPAPSREPPPPEADYERIVIRILWRDAQPAWELNEQRLQATDELRARLGAIVQANDQAPIIIHPDPETPFVFVMEVYDLSRQAGFAKVQLTGSLAG